MQADRTVVLDLALILGSCQAGFQGLCFTIISAFFEGMLLFEATRSTGSKRVPTTATKAQQVWHPKGTHWLEPIEVSPKRHLGLASA